MSHARRRLSPLVRSRLVTLAKVLALTVSTAAVAEATLQVLARWVPSFERVLFTRVPESIPDTRLLTKGNPRFFGHDDYGFRNPKGMSRAQIVAIGDSHTYGTSVQAAEAWPRVLERLSGCTVYSMALGGYGPLQYSALVRDSTRMRPSKIIVGIYFGNDFFDNWQMYRSNPTKYAVPKELLRAATERESKSSLRYKLVDFFAMGAAREPVRMKTIVSSIRKFLMRNSALWGYIRAIKHQLIGRTVPVLGKNFRMAVSALTPQQLEYASVFEGKHWRTIFTARYRLAVEDATDPRIILGRWLTELTIDDINNFGHSIGASVLFVLMPTKEFVFAPRVNDKSKHMYLERLVHDEALHREHIIGHLRNGNIAFLDASRVFDGLDSQPYFEDANGHPNPLGHEAIAKAIVTSITPCAPRD